MKCNENSTVVLLTKRMMFEYFGNIFVYIAVPIRMRQKQYAKFVIYLASVIVLALKSNGTKKLRKKRTCNDCDATPRYI